MAKKCKCDPHEICEECPEWIFTLADLIMCMMGLFVIMWVLKPSPTPNKTIVGDDLTKVLASIREAFGHIPDSQSDDPVDIQMLINKIEKQIKNNGPGEKGMTKVTPKGAEGTDNDVTAVRVSKQVIVGGRTLFERGEVSLSKETVQTLDELIPQVRGHRNVVLIKGHASLDDFEEGATADQRMQLSLRRAQTAADYLTSKGVEPEILRVVGCSTFEPVNVRAYTPATQAANRRVEIETTSTLAPELQDSPKQGKMRIESGKEH